MGESLDDMIAVQKHMKAERQARHARWKQQNTEILRKSGIPYTERPEALLFREPGMPKVDFYPSTGRWKVSQGRSPSGFKGGLLTGGANKFLEWYKKQYKGEMK